MRNGKHFAPLPRQAMICQGIPQPFRFRVLDITVSFRRDTIVSKQHIAVEVVTAGAAGIFIADKRTKPTGLTFIIGRFRGFLLFLPGIY